MTDIAKRRSPTGAVQQPVADAVRHGLLRHRADGDRRQPHDIARFGAEVMRFSPRQCDLMIVAGRVVMKMLPVLQRIWLQMPEPKWCISMGACASPAACSTPMPWCRDRPLHPGRHVRPRLPAAAGAADPIGHRLAGEEENSPQRSQRTQRKTVMNRGRATLDILEVRRRVHRRRSSATTSASSSQPSGLIPC
jgi:hypothetical protein